MTELLDYYSGSQARVFFDNVWIDDVNAISWSAQQEKRPLWGYASQKFDDVARGILVINGQFNINFRGRGYIVSVIDFIKSRGSNPKKTKDIQRYLDIVKNKNWADKDIVKLINDIEFDKYREAYEKIVWESETLEDPSFKRPDEYKEGLNIIVKYGSWGDNTVSSTKVLSGVHIVGQSQVVRVGGEPIAETYSFLARDIDEN